jgi:putative acetyltransferase
MIREYEPRDLSAIIDLFGRAVRQLAAHDYSAEQISIWAPQDPDVSTWEDRLSKGVVLVFLQKGRLAGFIRMENEHHLDLLYVHPEFQRQGVARALFARALKWAMGQGATQLISDVSITARPFFERMGFHVAQLQTIEREGIQLRNFRMMLDTSAQQGAAVDATTMRPRN